MQGNTYDGASSIMGTSLELLNKLNHYYGCSLNQTVKSTTDKCKLLKNTLDTIRVICIVVKFSTKRESWLGSIQDNIEEHSTYQQRPVKLNKMCATR